MCIRSPSKIVDNILNTIYAFWHELMKPTLSMLQVNFINCISISNVSNEFTHIYVIEFANVLISQLRVSQ